MRLGIIGGGQLARMMVPPAHRLGLEVWTLEKQDGCPARLVGAHQVVGDWSQAEVAVAFAREMDVVTLDHEFTPLAVLEQVEKVTRLAPGHATMGRIADKLEQKDQLSQAGLQVARSRAFQTAAELEEVGREFGWPLIVKARRGGYDGKGNLRLESPEQAEQVFEQLDGPLYAEEFVAFRGEVAVMVARGAEGETRVYPVVDTVQEGHICRCVRYPATLEPVFASRASEVARRAAEAVGVVGMLGVEMFVADDGRILVNELAPRPHNSGHYTLDATITCQFENHVRAVCGLPLGAVDPLVEQAVMVNLLGDGHGSGHPAGLETVLKDPRARLHLYGKAARPGRKLGHLTLLGGSREALEERALQLAARLTFKEEATR